MKIVITLDKDGKVGIEGPLQDRMFMYGLLDVAKDLVRSYNPKEKPLIEVPQLVQ